MIFTQEPSEVGSWRKEKQLGSGGFGIVDLWRNVETNEAIALKKCRWGKDPSMTPKHRHRWKIEVDIMFRLSHENVVTAIGVPQELQGPPTELPLLAMEYCCKGDLRSHLNLPENCCGLKEKQVRLLVKNISSAVRYLHSQKIIHRDLKPENIVIQVVDGKEIFKLIDLGYAKELDQGSLCHSFVGTVQYLAPELFLQHKYSGTVDLWSLGLVSHEVITGHRPFIPNMTPAEWIPKVKNKKSTDICASVIDGKITFSSEISPYNHITSILKKYLEEWLQLMLEFDPKKRGKKNGSSSFELLDRILNRKVVNVFSVDTCALMTIEVTENTTVAEVQKWLEKLTNIPIEQQYLLLPKGQPIYVDQSIMQFWCDPEEEELIVNLFHHHPPHLQKPIISIPPLVDKIMRNPKELMDYENQKVIWSQAVYLSNKELTLFQRLVSAYKAILLMLLTKNSALQKAASKMIGEMNSLRAVADFFKTSLQQDLTNYESYFKNRNSHLHEMYGKWRKNEEELNRIEEMQDAINKLEKSASEISTNTINFQRSPYFRSKQNVSLEEVHSRVLSAYSQLRKRPKDERMKPHDNTEMVRLMCLCLEHRENQLKEILTSLREVIEMKNKANLLPPKFESILAEIESWRKKLTKWQRDRQLCLLEVVDSLAKCVPTIPLQQSSAVSPEPFSSSSHILWRIPSSSNPPTISSTITNPGEPHALATSSCHLLPWTESKQPVINEMYVTSSNPRSRIFPQHSVTSSSSSSSYPSSVQSEISGPQSLSQLLHTKREESVRVKIENEDLMNHVDEMMKQMLSHTRDFLLKGIEQAPLHK